MISMANITVGQSERYYYTRDSLFGHNGVWFGKAAQMLGLEQDTGVQKEAFIALLSGLDPRTGEQIVAVGPTGEHKAGLDISFSVPKSFSIVAEALGDERLIEIFQDAVASTLAFVESNIVQARKSIDGEKVRVDTGTMVAALFQHSTSREFDPQLHMHAVVANITERDGKYVAIESKSLYENQHLMDSIFKSELAAGLREIGYRVLSDEKGNFEIAGVPEDIIKQFSKRSDQIDRKAEELRESVLDKSMNESALREQANLLSRQSKSHVDADVLRERWNDELAEKGYSPESFRQDVAKAGKMQTRDNDMTAQDYVKLGTSALIEHESTFNRADVLKTAGRLSMGEFRIGDLDRAYAELVENKELVQLDGTKGSVSGTYTTREMKRIEKSLVSMIQNGVGRAEALMTPETAEHAIDGYLERQRIDNPDFNITRGQRQAVYDVLTGDSKFLVIQGDAGAGKSMSFGVLNSVLQIYGESTGRQSQLLGLSNTGKATNELQKSSGIESMTLARYLMESKDNSESDHSGENEQAVPRKERIYIVDEASMTGSRDAYDLFKIAERDGSRVILVGDAKQLLGVSAGKLFTDIQEKSVIDVTLMPEVLRQKTEHMRDIVADISGKRVDSAFDRLEAHGKVHQFEDKDELIQAIATSLAARDNWQNVLVLANTNSDRHLLNEAIREELKAEVRIGHDDFSLTVRAPKNLDPVEKRFAQSFEVGDRIFASKAGGGLKAGTEAEVVAVDQEQHTVTLRHNENWHTVYDLKKHGDRLSVYAEEEKDFSTGEKIIFLKNDTKLGVQNGLTGIIERIDGEGNLTVTTDNGTALSFSTRNYSYFDHGMAISVYKSQGMTADSLMYYADSRNEDMNTMNSFYTGITRGRFDAELFTDDKNAIREQMKMEATKASTLDYDKKLAEIHTLEKELELSRHVDQGKTDKEICDEKTVEEKMVSTAAEREPSRAEHQTDNASISSPSSFAVDGNDYEPER